MTASPAVIESFRKQAGWCGQLGAPFMQRLLTAATAELEAGGWLAQRIGAWPGDPVFDALPLRVAGALHALVLDGRAPRLARLYPPHDEPDDDALWPAASLALQENAALLDEYLARAPQTNEIGRAALLFAGCSDLVARHRLPLRLFEIGASAGLNLLWNRYRYRLGDAARGAPGSAVEIVSDWRGPLPPAVDFDIRERRGCDLAPLDLADPAQRLRLRSYLWPDQPQRLARLDAAIAEALRTGLPQVDSADAVGWLPALLPRRPPGLLTVVQHTVVWQYLPPPVREHLTRSIESAGRHATAESPLAWLRFETFESDLPTGLHLTEWPGGTTRKLARAHPHGLWIHWRAET